MPYSGTSAPTSTRGTRQQLHTQSSPVECKPTSESRFAVDADALHASAHDRCHCRGFAAARLSATSSASPTACVDSPLPSWTASLCGSVRPSLDSAQTQLALSATECWYFRPTERSLERKRPGAALSCTPVEYLMQPQGIDTGNVRQLRPHGPSAVVQDIAGSLFATSIFPYAGHFCALIALTCCLPGLVRLSSFGIRGCVPVRTRQRREVHTAALQCLSCMAWPAQDSCTSLPNRSSHLP